MSPTAESVVITPEKLSPESADPGLDRRADIEAKQRLVGTLLGKAGCDGFLVLEPENFAWLTSGAAARGVLDAAEMPVLYFTSDQRWVIACNVDSQRLFDEELNGLGFQLKEWPWQWGREQLLADLSHNRKIACDRPMNSHKVIGDQVRGLRRTLTPYEQACFQVLGSLVSHALEATCRTMSAEITEREVAAQISHRLLHRGVQPVCIEVAADGRSRRYRQCGYTSLPIRRYCVMSLTARKYGLYVTSSRAVCFGDPDPSFKKEHDAACKISATYIASTWPDALPKQIFTAGQHTFRLTGFEHEWRLCPQGHITGHLPVEMSLLPSTEELFQANWAVTWRASVGAAFSSDTFLIHEEGPRLITPPEMWPLKRIRVQGADFFRPDLLLR